MTDGHKRFDLCLAHFDGVIGYYGNAVHIVEEWGERPPVVEIELVEDTIAKINAARGVDV